MFTINKVLFETIIRLKEKRYINISAFGAKISLPSKRHL